MAVGIGPGACDVTLGRVGSQLGTLLAALLSLGGIALTGRLPRPLWLCCVPGYFIGILIIYPLTGGEDAYELCPKSMLTDSVVMFNHKLV